MSGAPLSFPAQYPNIYAYGKAHSLQVLPAAIAPTLSTIAALARRGAGPRVPVHPIPLASASNPKSGRAIALRDERKKGAPRRRRGWADAGYGNQSGKQ